MPSPLISGDSHVRSCSYLYVGMIDWPIFALSHSHPLINMRATALASILMALPLVASTPIDESYAGTSPYVHHGQCHINRYNFFWSSQYCFACAGTVRHVHAHTDAYPCAPGKLWQQ